MCTSAFRTDTWPPASSKPLETIVLTGDGGIATLALGDRGDDATEAGAAVFERLDLKLEMTAKQLYPDVFGEWPADGSEDTYPEISVDEQLFDRQRVTDIINGDT